MNIIQPETDVLKGLRVICRYEIKGEKWRILKPYKIVETILVFSSKPNVFLLKCLILLLLKYSFEALISLLLCLSAF